MGQAPILLVNNEPDLVTLVRYMLAGAVQVVHATSADDALSRIHMHLPEVIVLDFLLPGFDGLAFCRRLKHMPLTAATPIMVLTDGETEADFIARLELGITDSLSKAWSPRVLVAYIRAMLRRKNGAARSAAESIMHGGLVINPGRHEVQTTSAFCLLQCGTKSIVSERRKSAEINIFFFWDEHCSIRCSA
jgi:two-component system phosphate regulon response regulator PhoB